MKAFESLEEIKKEVKKVNSGVSSDTIFIAKSIPYLAECLTKIARFKKKEKRKPSAWMVFAGKYLKEGKTIQEASKAWQERKNK